MENEPKKKAPRRDCKIRQVAETLRKMNQTEIPTDVLGSYTGLTREGEKPTRDADGL